MSSSSALHLLVLVGVTLLLYAPAGQFDYVHFDDPHFFYGPPQIRQGLNSATLSWALTNTDGAYWHPVASVAHLVSFTIVSSRPGPQHLVSVAFFVATVGALYAVLRAATGQATTAFIATALWAWHPLRVESVAWLTERGALLAALFCVLTVGAYLRYARRPNVARFAVVALGFTVTMLCKPTAPALPLALLAVDLWPLGRLAAAWQKARWRGAATLMLEKVPLLLIAVAITVLTIKLGSEADARLRPMLSPSQRLLAIPAGYGWFLLRTVLPVDIAVHYPWSNTWTTPQSAAAAMALVGVTVGLLWARKAALTAGWLWFLLLLLPMLVGAGLRTSWVAGRYATIPHQLLFAGLAATIPRSRAMAWTIYLVLAAMAVTSASQLQQWRNSQTLFTHTLSITRDNYIVHYNMGVALQAQGQLLEAAEHYRRALRIEPRYFEAHVNLGAALEVLGDHASAEQHYRAALNINPNDPDARANLDAVLARRSQGGGAVAPPTSAPRLLTNQ
jgi:protein O-mannosyl-transferase